MWEDMYAVCMDLVYKKRFARSQYIVQRASTKGEIGHLEYSLNGNILYIHNLTVLKSATDYRGLEDAHIGTNLFSDALTDLYFRQGIRFTEIRGRLSSADAQNGNWLTSIPFYQSFPKYLNPALPFTMEFTISEHRDFRTILDMPVAEMISRYQELYFRYSVIS